MPDNSRRVVNIPARRAIPEGPDVCCPDCGCNQSEIKTADAWFAGQRRLRRKCDHCGLNFTTIQKQNEV